MYITKFLLSIHFIIVTMYNSIAILIKFEINCPNLRERKSFNCLYVLAKEHLKFGASSIHCDNKVTGPRLSDWQQY